jgi:hypothetical protein
MYHSGVVENVVGPGVALDWIAVRETALIKGGEVMYMLAPVKCPMLVAGYLSVIHESHER